LTLEENIEFGIKGRVEKKVLRNIVQELLEMVGLSDFAKATPNQLSGGMAQRAAIARALAADPLILLLDEPFAALDAQTRAKLQTDFLRLWQSTHITCIHVTHDIDEALILGEPTKCRWLMIIYFKTLIVGYAYYFKIFCQYLLRHLQPSLIVIKLACEGVKKGILC